MQKIIIKNFAGIEYAEIEIKKVLVLIGEQASGKSTIAKLIYFFQSLIGDLFIQIYSGVSENRENFDEKIDLILPIKDVFYLFFGSNLHSPSFEILFYYNYENNKYLKLYLDSNKNLNVQFSQNFVSEDFINFVNQIRKEQAKTHPVYDVLLGENLRKELRQLLEDKQNDQLFIICGRNATVTYSDLFEKYLFSYVQRTREDNLYKDFTEREQVINEALMLEFIERFSRSKEVFKKNNSFEGLIKHYVKSEDLQQKLESVLLKIHQILKGKYKVDGFGEKIILNEETQEYVYLNNASAGQQESIRILQDIFLTILYNSAVLRIIEEPEAHLFPIAQKQLIELLALMVNHNEDNQLIITTHSPYILTVFNNLLVAKRVVEKNPSVESEVSQIIPQESWLDATQFSAYSLGNHYWEGEIPYCQSIFNPEQGTIEQNYLDSVSEILGSDFDQLYRIHARSFKRR